MFERRVEGLPCSRSDAETQAAAWRRVAWRGREAGNSASMGQGQCLSLHGNCWAGERRDHEDGMEGAGPWGATQVPRAVLGLRPSGAAGGGGEESLAVESCGEGELGS